MSLAAGSTVNEAQLYSENIQKLLWLQLGHNEDIRGRMQRGGGSSASLSYMPGSGTRHPFRGLTEKQTPTEGFTQRGDCWRRVQPQRSTHLYHVAICVHVCMHVCTYIIHVHYSIGQRVRNTTHTLGRGKGCQGTEEAPLILGGAGVVNGGPSSRQASWVSGWVANKEKRLSLEHSSQR